ncbi:MAG: carboxypeptidase-like regulatory domain-containing protein [Pseudomonadota bacterium]
MKSKIIEILITLIAFCFLFNQISALTFSGKLVDKDSQEPLSNVDIFIIEKNYKTKTDQDGNFAINDLEASEYTVIIDINNYIRIKEQIKLESNLIKIYEAIPQVYNLFETSAIADKEDQFSSKKKLSTEEIRRIPGVGNDIFKALESLPGIANSTSSSKPGSGMGFVVRGSNPEDSYVSLDGHKIPMLYHFMGFASVFPSSFIDSIDFEAGGFSAKEGNASGGIFTAKSREGIDKLKIEAEFGSFITGVSGEIPITDNHSLFIAGRRSMIDLILPFVITEDMGLDFTVMPQFYDYQFKYNWDINDNNSFKLVSIGSSDALGLINENAVPGEPDFSGEIYSKQSFYKTYAIWDLDLNNINLNISPFHGFDYINFSIGENKYLIINSHELALRGDLSWEMNKYNTLSIGFYPQWWYFDAAVNFPSPPREGEMFESFSQAETSTVDVENSSIMLNEFYIEDTLTLFNKLKIIPGTRFYHAYKLGGKDFFFDPRILLKFLQNDKLTYTFACGQYSRTPDYIEVDSVFGNPEVEPESSIHYVAGVEYEIIDSLISELQVYYNDMNKLIVTSATPLENVNNDGDGYATGFELFLKKDLTDKFFGWLSYALTFAKRRDNPNEEYRSFDFDQTHSFNLIASYKLNEKWEFGGKIRYNTNNPETPVTGSYYDADYSAYYPIYSDDTNSERLPYYLEVDLRVDRIFRFKHWMLDLYLDIINANYRSNVIGKTYNYDYTEWEHTKLIPIYPSMGFIATF